jgi:hypothetical protein
MPLKQGKENKNQTPSSRRNKPGQQQSECKDPKQVLGEYLMNMMEMMKIVS